MRISKGQKKLWTVILGFFVLNTAIVAFVTVPFMRHILFIQEDIARAQQSIVALDEERARFLAIERIITKEADVFKRIEETTLSLSSPLRFIELAETLAREQNLEARLLVRDQPSGGFQNFQIIAEGTFPRIHHYIELLELMPYQVSFSRFQLEFFEQGTTETAIRTRSENLRTANRPIVSRLTLDIAVRAK